MGYTRWASGSGIKQCHSRIHFSARTSRPLRVSMGVGQWHKAMSFTDPFFGSNFAAVTSFETAYGRTLDYNTAGCLAAGVVVWRALAYSSGNFAGATDAQKKTTLRTALSSFNEETMWGTVIFNTDNQNAGRGTAAWQVQM